MDKYITINKIDKETKKSKGGGSNTTLFGKHFETVTDNENRLIIQGYNVNSFSNKKSKNKFDYLTKTLEDRTIVFVKQSNFKKYILGKYGIGEDLRHPDEAYIIHYKNGRNVVKIVEKKEQHMEGSVDLKLWAGPSIKREYELILKGFEIQYLFCVNSFLQEKFIKGDKRYNHLNTILDEDNIKVLFGEDDDYYDNLDKWIYD